MYFRVSMYIVFLILTAPIEIYAYYANGKALSNNYFIEYPWTHGVVYVVAILLFAETSFRIAHNFQFVKHSGLCLIVLTTSSLCGFGSALYYFAHERLIISLGKKLTPISWDLQNILILVSGVLSITSVILVERELHKIESFVPKQLQKN